MNIVEASYQVRKLASWTDMLKLVEEIARTCYKSEENITELSYVNFLRGIIDRGHEAMIEHVGFSVKFICDRGVSHELVRHRLASFAQESTRYCNYSHNKFSKELTFILPSWFQYGTSTYMDVLNQQCTEQVADNELDWLQQLQSAEDCYLRLLDQGWKPEQARSVLPNSTKTEIWVTMNLREWRHFFSLRSDKPAHPQMRELAVPLLVELKEECPLIFADILPNVVA